MSSFIPFRCATEATRRLCIGLLIVSLLSWVTWVGFASDGFSQVKPIGWLVFFGAPIAVYFALVTALTLLRKAKSTEIRLFVSVNILWVFLAGAWGYIWQWKNEFSLEQYLALFVLPLIGVWLGLFLWRWTKAG